VLVALAHVVKHVTPLARNALLHAAAEVVHAARAVPMLPVEVVVRAPVTRRLHHQRRSKAQPVPFALTERRRHRIADADELLRGGDPLHQTPEQGDERHSQRLPSAYREQRCVLAPRWGQTSSAAPHGHGWCYLSTRQRADL
jgi:hypothetical protein